MDIKNTKIALEQIYNFTCEMPGFAKKSNFEKIILFCINVQDSLTSKNYLDNDRTLIVINGKEVLLNLIDAPKFINKGTFINWIFNKIPK